MKGPVLTAALLVAGFTLGGELAVAHSARPWRPEPALSGPAAPWAACRQASQAMRIRQGLRQGQLTPREAVPLLRRHRQIARAMRCNCASPLRLEGRQRRHLDRQLDSMSRRIWRERHNRQRWF